MRIPTQYQLIMPIGQFQAMRQCMWPNLVDNIGTNCNAIAMQVAPPDDQVLDQSKLCHLVVKFVINAGGAIWWQNLQLMQVVSSCGQIFNLCKWRHLVAKFATNVSGAKLLPSPIQVTKSISGSVVPLAMFLLQLRLRIPKYFCAEPSWWSKRRRGLGS